MNKYDMKRLSRRDLLEMLLELTTENEKLQQRNQELEDMLQDRTIAVEEAGSLAESALRLNNVFQAAQEAADQYLLNVQQRCRKLEEETEEKCAQLLKNAESQE